MARINWVNEVVVAMGAVADGMFFVLSGELFMTGDLAFDGARKSEVL